MKSKTVKIDETPVTVRELTVTDISDLFAMDDNADIAERMAFMLARCSSLKIEDIRKHAPSDLQPMIDALVEVNASFFGQADQVGMAQAAGAIKTLFQSLSMVVFAPVSQPDTGEKSGNTPGHSSS